MTFIVYGCSDTFAWSEEELDETSPENDKNV